MPCLPGFFPVMNEVHAGGVIGGRTDCRLPETPTFMSLARFGMPPSAIHGRMSVHVAASSPMNTTFGFFFISRADNFPCKSFPRLVSEGARTKSFVNAPRLHPHRIKTKVSDLCTHRRETFSNYVTFVKWAVEHHMSAASCPRDLSADRAGLARFRVKLLDVWRTNARRHLLLV